MCFRRVEKNYGRFKYGNRDVNGDPKTAEVEHAGMLRHPATHIYLIETLRSLPRAANCACISEFTKFRPLSSSFLFGTFNSPRRVH